MSTQTLEAPEVKEAKETAPEAAAETKPEDKEAPKAFDPASLPAEAIAHFEKKYEGYDKYKAATQEYDGLIRDPRFLDWYSQGGLKQKTEAPAKFEISDEDFVAALSDKNKFLGLVNAAAEKIAIEKLGPDIRNVKAQAEFAQKSSELDQTIKKYPDFMELDKRGLIEPVLKKYNGRIDYEDAYWIAKRHTFNEEVDKKSRGIVSSKKNASVEKPNNTSGQRSNVVKVKNRLEAMEIAADYHKRGQEPPDFDFE